MKKSLLLAILLIFAQILFAQDELLVQHSDKGLYLSHTVVSGENFYSVGRLFNVSAKDIAAFNQIDMNNGLVIGQSLKIPLNATNFDQDKSGGRPVYYVVGPSEGLYRVSVKNKNVLMANVRKWNSLKNDNLQTGQKLIIGYLNSSEADRIVQSNPVVEKNTVTTPEPKKENTVTTPEPKKENPVVQAPVEEKKEEPKKIVVPEKKEEATSVKTVSNPTPLNDGKGGFFKSQYDQQVRQQPAHVDQTVAAGIFKTVSGWQDAKYYALMDGVEPGTIIRITNPTNNKSIYAKILGEMSGIRQNQGYDIRMSNAAAAALEVGDMDKFIVRVNY